LGAWLLEAACVVVGGGGGDEGPVYSARFPSGWLLGGYLLGRSSMQPREKYVGAFIV